jgi:hypothetical protein
VLLAGAQRIIVYAFRPDGSSPARDYLEGLDRADQRKFAALFQRMAEIGRVVGEERFKKLQDVSWISSSTGRRRSGAVWEFKIDGHRMLSFPDGRDWVLTNGCPKIARGAFQGVIATARGIM